MIEYFFSKEYIHVNIHVFYIYMYVKIGDKEFPTLKPLGGTVNYYVFMY